jgi:pyruvate carboxylase
MRTFLIKRKLLLVFFKSYTIRVNNNTYIAISNPLDILIKEMGFETELRNRSILSKHYAGIDSGNQCCGGSRGKRNDNLIILGAMKMENSFLSPRDGIIKSISVATGDAVDKGQLLVEFE